MEFISVAQTRFDVLIKAATLTDPVETRGAFGSIGQFNALHIVALYKTNQYKEYGYWNVYDIFEEKSMNTLLTVAFVWRAPGGT